MIYLKTFYFPSNEREALIYKNTKYRMSTSGSFYPYGIFPEKGLSKLSFSSPITILYGGNGSGKTTLLNIISEKLSLKREALYNRTHWFEEYLDYCFYETIKPIPANSLMITSDDVFNFMLNLRALNQGIDETRENLVSEYFNVRNNASMKELVNKIDYNNTESVLDFERKWSIMKGTVNKFIQHNVENNVREHSNGESAIQYFFNKIENDALYLLDEPENSLSPERQLELVEYIQDSAIGCGCQFIIATHSPFLLAMQRSEIYDLDSYPVVTKKWTELRNVNIYRDFFKKHEKEFKIHKTKNANKNGANTNE